MSLDLSVSYGGLLLHSPIVVGSCPMTVDDQTRLSLESAGAGAIVLPPIFEEQNMSLDSLDAKSYLALVNRSSNQLAIPVIASINGRASECCVDFAGELQEAGAAGIELNLQCGPDSEFFGSGEIEDSFVESIEAFGGSVSVPLFAKLSQNGVSLPHLARRWCSSVAGMVLHGRRPDTDVCLDTLGLRTHWNLNQPCTSLQLIEPVMRLRSHCPAMSIAAGGGISTCEDVAKVLLAGADVAMVTSELYRSGPDAIRTMIDGLVVFLERHHFASLGELQMNCPIAFTGREARSRYVSAMSNRLHPSSNLSRNRGEIAATPALRKPRNREIGRQECDRWGHLMSEIGDTSENRK